MEDKRHITALFEKFLQNEYTAEELEEILHYFKQENIDGHLTELIQNELDQTNEISYEVTQEMAANIEHRLYRTTRTPKRLNRKRWLLIAAAILLLFSSPFIPMIIEMIEKPKQSITQAKGDILPGKNRATLTLDDGRIIALSEEKEGVVSMGTNFKYDDGTQIENLHTQYVELSTPRGGQYRVTLPDGTNVFLNAESSLEYPIAFGQERMVKLSGEGFFEIKEDKSKPFLVQSANLTVKVLGTTFNMNTYQESTVTTLVSGKVSLASSNGTTEILAPNQQATLHDNAFEIKNVDVSDYVAWTRGYIVINNATITDVIKQVERWYDVDFDLRSHATTTAYVSINRESKLSEVLEALEINYGIKFKMDGRRIIEME